MAFTTDDFNKIWASASPLTPYEFSDSNYTQGWNFVGSTPPARQMWDKYMNLADQKMQYLYNNYLPLSGGTMTGAIIRRGDFVFCSVDDSFTRYNGGSEYEHGASLQLNGQDSTSNGRFALIARKSGVGASVLVGDPNGTLTWDGKNIERIESSGTNYIRYVSGLQICWGTMNVPGAAVSDETITFPMPFKDGSSYNITVGRSWAYNSSENYIIKSTTATNFVWSTIGTVSDNSHSYRYVAIGWWK